MEKVKINYLITDQNITVNFNGQTHIVSRTDSLSDRLIKAIKEGKIDEIPNLVSAAKRVETFSNGEFLVKDGKIFVDGIEAPPVLGNKIVKFANEGLHHLPLVKFAKNLQKNPSFRAVNELFSFLEKNDHPISENGEFIAYKRIRSDFTDIYTGTMDNSIGKVVEMPRNQVNEDCNKTCSNGLHVANWDYAFTKFGSDKSETDIMIEVEVDPADVVAVPVDYSNSKIRVCKYKVLGVIDKENSSDMQLRITKPQVTWDEGKEPELDEEPEACKDCDHCFCNECHVQDDICEDCDSSHDECECELCIHCDEVLKNCTCKECEECGELVEDCDCDEDDEYDWETELDDLKK